MLAACYEIEPLVGTTSAWLDSDRDEVLSEIASSRIDEETLAVGGFEGDGCEGSSCGIVTLVRFCC